MAEPKKYFKAISVRTNTPLERGLAKFELSRNKITLKIPKTIIYEKKLEVNKSKNNMVPEIINLKIQSENKSTTADKKNDLQKKLSTSNLLLNNINTNCDTNRRFSQLITTSIEQFNLKRENNDDEREYSQINKNSDPESFDDNKSIKSFDRDDFISKNQEINEIKKEISQRIAISSKHQQQILRLMFDTNYLNSRMKNPFDVF